MSKPPSFDTPSLGAHVPRSEIDPRVSAPDSVPDLGTHPGIHPTAIHRCVEACRTGKEPGVIARLPSGWAVMGQRQVLRGYCLLLPDPVVPHLNALDVAARDRFMADLGRLGDAVLAATGALRINYAIFGNLEPALHAHVHPRYADEPEAMRTANPWTYDWSQAPQFDLQSHGELRNTIGRQLRQSP